MREARKADPPSERAKRLFVGDRQDDCVCSGGDLAGRRLACRVDDLRRLESEGKVRPDDDVVS